MKVYALAIAAISLVGVQYAYSTHVSIPVLAVMDLEYPSDQDLVISGWVEYDGRATSDVLLSVKVLDPFGSLVSESFVTSDPDGEFEFLFEPSGRMPGVHTVEVTSMCREEHRQICAHRAAHVTVNVLAGSDIVIPQWVKTAAEFWTSGKINDDSFVQIIKFLMHEGTIIIPDIVEFSDAAQTGIPDWIKTEAHAWAAGSSTDEEFADIIRWLVSDSDVGSSELK